jgi:hypothetical protein
MKILLDYFFPITVIDPTPAASTAFLKQALVIVKPTGSDPDEDEIVECTTAAQIDVQTTNADADQLLAGGMSKVFILATDTLDIADLIAGQESDFYTIIISSDFSDAEVTATQAQGVLTVSNYANLLTTTPDVVTIEGTAFTAQAGVATLGTATFRAATSNEATAISLAAQINGHATVGALVEATVVGAIVTIKAANTGKGGNDIGLSYTDNGAEVGITLAGLSGGNLAGGDGLHAGEFEGVIGLSSTDDTFLATHAAIANRCAFHTSGSNGAKNLCYAFGKMLSNVLNWRNQQYITMPYADDVETVGDANSLFDDRISFVISDDEFGQRLGLFCAGGKAITAPYIKKNLIIDLQSAALTYISGNQPEYSLKHAALIEDELQKVINEDYIDEGLIEAGTAEVTLEEDNFVASGEFNISEPKALWRIFGNMEQTL